MTEEKRLTDDLHEAFVDLACDERNGKETEVKLESTTHCVDVFILVG